MTEWTFDKIVARCKASVHIDVNNHLGYYDPLDHYIDETVNRFDKDVSDIERERILKAGVLYELQFYPDTPIGFNKVYGTSFGEVIAKAGAILEGETS